MKAQVSFSSGLPLLVMLMANMNSLPAVGKLVAKEEDVDWTEAKSPEVNGATLVGVKSPEDVLTESCGIAPWEHSAVHGDKLIFGKLSFRAILDESLVPSLARTSIFSI